MKFSTWKLWDNRNEHQLTQYPGIYAISISDAHLEGESFDISDDVVYFGMSNSVQGIKGRLEQFNNSLRDKRGGKHGGCERVRYDFPDGEQLAKRLFVSVLPFLCNTKEPSSNDLKRMGEVVKAEYDAFAWYFEAYGHLPKYNDKRLRPPKQKS
ncbi:Uncharacterised protein [Vibrio mimicus]|uniref:hypothetical protein n=1 Tax=Vibrio mimicus TaxID=674 RepID=UPI0002BB4CDA|nr:hypothetical protein [Vibrio mimicus]EMB48292.1 hypothetical protein D908_19933 [Vibrio mimicus CAIM 602]MBY7676798.1 hypothetical protein [Vibrio mimicus]MBY7728647.1 hypothetical protein [Vibrio mimicus]TXY29726.1 hypothetical protein FXE86_13515 [Vibrio mimicus]SUQ23427.1 Uncharacterised protein [Vibrio mimicus]